MRRRISLTVIAAAHYPSILEIAIEGYNVEDLDTGQPACACFPTRPACACWRCWSARADRGRTGRGRGWQPRVSTHLAKLKGTVWCATAAHGVSTYYRCRARRMDRAQRALWSALSAGADDPLRSDAAPAGCARGARHRAELGRFGGRRHGAPLFARPHLGSLGAHRAAAAVARRRARHRVGRRRAGGTAVATRRDATSASIPASAW